MPKKSPSMILSASIMHGTGMHFGSWLVRDGEASDYITPEMYLEIARVAETGKLHALFFADGITNYQAGVDRPSGALDPVTILSLIAAVTKRIGLVGTASTTYNQPYDVARRFATLDHLSKGRSGWNSVATMNPSAGSMFGGVELPDHANRYARADEFIEVVFKLWDSWKEGSFVGDKANALFAREELVGPINHTGKYFSVKGPLPFPRVPQGRPVVFQAGSSEVGRNQAAKYADVVFTAQHLLEDAAEFRSDIRKRAAAYGRDPDQIKVLPGMFAILGKTKEEAWNRKRSMDDVLGTGPELTKLGMRVGIPAEAFELDKPFPMHLLKPESEFKGSLGFRRTIISLATKENLTMRELVARYGGGHHQVVGTAEHVADMMQTWIDGGAADGFNLMVDMVPSGFHAITDLLVPELQRRGMFHRDYEHATLRENLGLAPPKPLDKTSPAQPSGEKLARAAG